MKAMPGRRAHLVVPLICLMLLQFSSCLARRRLITRRGSAKQGLLTSNRDELLRRVAEQYQTIQDLNATVDMVPALGSAEKSRITEYKDVRAYILFRKPSEIRIVGLFPVVRNKAFDMVSTGQDFRLYIPAKNRFITGSNEIIAPSPNRLENLRPQHFLDAMFVRPVQGDEKAILENYTDEDNADYILHLIRPHADGALQLTRTIWFDRANLRMARQLIFDDSGNILTDARYSGWQNYSGVPFPKQIDINRPRDEYAVVINVVKMDVNKGVTEDKFALDRPEGTELQIVGQPPAVPPKEAPKEAPKTPTKGRKSK